MLDLHGHNSTSTGKASSQKDGVSLTQWVHRVVGIKRARVRSRLRGNHLHILFEHQPCPEPGTIVPRLMDAFATASLKQLLPPNAPPIYRVIVYGRLTDQSNPEWTESFYLNQPAPTTAQPEKPAAASVHRSNTPAATQRSPLNSPLQLSNAQVLELARQGQPDEIARYLSHAFSNIGTAIRARIEVIEPDIVKQDAAQEPDLLSNLISTNRLIVSCESTYCPDPLLLAEPIAQRLRELELKGFLDAVVFGQVSGEARPEWVLRIDLTPPDEILKDWARWGDVQAITRLLNRVLAPQQIEVSTLLKDSTLHLNCKSNQSAMPDKILTIATVAPLLISLSPQGICAATLYGLAHERASGNSESPVWVDWLNLPAATEPTLAQTTLELAQQGNVDAIAFLLTRLLNPNLDTKLATGGIRVQIRQKDDLLHIMTDAPTCPQQNQVGTSIARFLQPFQIPDITGVRIYGRRAGQKRPLWSYGLDFTHRTNRLVPEATPEFAVSDAYVGDLLAPPGALVLRSDLPPSDWKSVLGRVLTSTIEQVQQTLIRFQLFVPLEPDAASSNLTIASEPSATASSQPATKAALVWSAVGLLLVIQTDWILGQWLQSAPSAPTSPQQLAVSPSEPPVAQATPPLPNLTLNKSQPPNPAAFNSTGFTQPGAELLLEPPKQLTTGENSLPAPVSLAASPLQPKAAIALAQTTPYPTFNSRQLDEKIALYKQHIAEQGPPDILVIGSSRALRGIDPVALQKALIDQGYPRMSVFNFGINGATAQVVDLVIRQILPQEKLPKLILWADGARAFNSGRSDLTQNGILASEGYRTLVAGTPPIAGTTIAQSANQEPAAGPVKPTSVSEESPSLSAGYQTVNQALDKRLGVLSLAYTQRDQLKSVMRDKVAALLPNRSLTGLFGGAIASRNLTDATSPAAAAANSPSAVMSEGQGMIDKDGFLPLPNRFNPATYYQKYARVPGDYDSDYESFNLEGKQTEALVVLAQFTQTHQIPLIFVNLPLTNDYMDPPRKRHEEAFQQHMLRLSTQIGFVYRDLNQTLASQPDYFSDPSHLNRYGAYEVSRRLAQDAMMPWQSVR